MKIEIKSFKLKFYVKHHPMFKGKKFNWLQINLFYQYKKTVNIILFELKYFLVINPPCC